MIDGVVIRELVWHRDERGSLMEAFRRSDSDITQFGRVYITTGYPGVVKAWHLHRLQWDHLVVVDGAVVIALYDAREDSPTYHQLQVQLVSAEDPYLIKIPPGVYHGFRAVGDRKAMILNYANTLYDPTDEYRIDPFDNHIPFDWRQKHG